MIRTCRQFLVAVTIFLSAGLMVGGCTSKHPPDSVAALPVGSLVQDWKIPLDLGSNKDEIRALYLRDDTLFAYSRRNTVVAISAASGKLLYGVKVRPDGIPLKPPIVLKERVAFPDGSTIEIYDRRGKKVESIETDHSIRSAGMAAGNTIYVGMDYPTSGRLAAIDLTRKFDRARWELMTPNGGISSAPAIHQNIIYFASENGRVYAIGEDRTGVWPLEHSAFITGGKIVADLKADDLGVYVASTDSKLYCLDLATGKIKWQYFAGTPLVDSPIVTSSGVYLPVAGAGLVALGKTEGKYNREATWTAKGVTGYLAEDAKYVYAAAGDQHIVALDKASGAVKFRSERDDLVAFAVNVNEKDSTIYASTRDGTVLAIKPVIKPGVVGTLVMSPVRLDDLLAVAR